MADLALSAGVEVAWQLAGNLALQEKSSLIEPKHLLFGICSVEKLQSQEGFSRDDAVARARSEANQLHDLAARHQLDLAFVRRAMRMSRGEPSGINPPEASGVQNRKISRSPATRRLFEVATGFSRYARASQVDLLSLLRATLESLDPQIEQATAPVAQSLSRILRELQRSKPAETSVIDIAPELRDLDTLSKQARPEFHIGETVDATIAIGPQPITGPLGGERPSESSRTEIERLAALSELTWEFGTQGAMNSMLQTAAEQLLGVISPAERCAILVRDANDGRLLLRACGPLGTTPMVSMTSASRALTEKKAFIWNRGEDLTLSQRESNIESGLYVPLVVNHQATGVICLDCSCSEQSFDRGDLLLVTAFAHQLALAIANHELRVSLKQNSDVLERLLTNFSPKVRTRLLQRAQLGRLRLGGEQSVVTILCADIRGFAQLTAKMQTEDVVELLNEYFAALTDCIFRNDGTIDKFVGDAILAVFGSPEADPQHCLKALRTGVEMQRTMEEVSQRRQARGDVACQIGVGIHTGEVLHGFIGSPERMEFTIIGEAVNRTARYCDAAKSGEVLISPEVQQWVWNMAEAEQITIPTKHEGGLLAYRVKRMKGRG